MRLKLYSRHLRVLSGARGDNHRRLKFKGVDKVKTVYYKNYF